MKIKSINIIEFKGIRDKKICFDTNINYIVGNNNVGKTRVLESIYAFYNKEKGVNISITYIIDDKDKEKLLELKIDLSNINEITIDLKDGKHFFEEQDLKNVISKENKFGQVIYIPAVINYTDEQNIGKSSSSTYAAFSKLILKNEILDNELKDLNEKLESYVDLVKENTSGVCEKINSNIAFKNIEVTLKKNDIAMEQIIKNNLKLGFKENGVDKSFEQLGTGIQRNIINSILINSKDENFVIYLYDEPETYINVSAQKKLISSFFQNMSSQYIIATHSPSIIKRENNLFKKIIKIKKNTDDNIEIFQFNEQEYKNSINATNTFLTSKGVNKDKLLKSTLNNSIIAWWDSNRVNALFEDKIILIEGATEEIFLDMILDAEYSYASTLGKYRMPYFIIMFKEIFGIEVISIFDKDTNEQQHFGFNEWIKNNSNSYIEMDKDLESELGYSVPNNNNKSEYLLEKYCNGEILKSNINKLENRIKNECK